jgi:hypothetical protein
MGGATGGAIAAALFLLLIGAAIEAAHRVIALLDRRHFARLQARRAAQPVHVRTIEREDR